MKTDAEKLKLYEAAILWILTDSAFKAPEQIGDIAARWIERLQRVVEEIE